MKKRLFSVVIAIAIAVLAGYNLYVSKGGTKLSNLVLSNVEALANYGETTPLDCYMAHCCYDPSYDCFGNHNGRWHYCPNMRGY